MLWGLVQEQAVVNFMSTVTSDAENMLDKSFFIRCLKNPSGIPISVANMVWSGEHLNALFQERLDYEYHCKLKENERSTAEKAAKKRAKRQRRKQHLRAKRSKGAPGNKNNSSSSSETEDSEESEEENVPGNSAEKDEEANKCEDRVKESDENCVVEVNGNNLPDSCDTNVSQNNMQDEKEEATSSDIPSEEKAGESTCTKKSLKELLNKNILKLKEKEDT
ncbi:hypothetical protein HAZT_HAZT004079 [Hyalella azteca]|uniref:Uncharacterized protein n=1 Tax=Hyalella azteca TaxID=294128 RepID=A0A6A0H5Z7_HYAAZ|nr:hypothetical protein HAZT_HAZT004079 [Hyalella azteca]